MQSVTEQDLIPFNRETPTKMDPEGVRALLQMDVSESESSFNEPDKESNDLKKSTKSSKLAAPKGPVKVAVEPCRVSGLIDAELSERLKNYVIFMMSGDESITVQRVISEAVAQYIFEREEENGGTFPQREVEIKRGRRPKSQTAR